MKKSLFPIIETSATITLKNKYLQITISKEGGKVLELINLMTGDSILDKSAPFPFAEIVTKESEPLSPSSLMLENGKLKFVFNQLFYVYVTVDLYSDYIALTLDSDIPDTVSAFSFGVLKADYFWALDNENAFGLSGLAMTTTVDPEIYPGGSFKATKATVYTAIGVPLKGSKFGIAFSRMTEHREHLKSIVDDIDPAKGITSKHGGPYALDHKDIYGDYVILQRGLTPQTASENVNLCNEYSVEQIDMHQGPRTFTQGDFNFLCAATEEEIANNTYVPASAFKERIADKITSQGIQLSLHTYSSLISKYASSVLSNPKWQQQIVYGNEVYSVKGELTNDATDVFTHEDASNIIITDDTLPYRNCHTKFILIDEEIILVNDVNASGFFNVERGMFGTKAIAHKDGAEIRHLYGWYGMFQPKPLSELFYHIAEETAKAYNDGGYEMIYLDGLESCIRDESFCTPDQRYYVLAEFVRTVVSNCKVDPLIEYSIFFPYLWNARGRGGAWDISNRGHKVQKAKHLKILEKFPRYFYTATVGWFGYAPDRKAKYKNTITETVFRDDLDFMGSLAVANNFCTVCNPFSIADFPTELCSPIILLTTVYIHDSAKQIILPPR